MAIDLRFLIYHFVLRSIFLLHCVASCACIMKQLILIWFILSMHIFIFRIQAKLLIEYITEKYSILDENVTFQHNTFIIRCVII